MKKRIVVVMGMLGLLFYVAGVQDAQALEKIATAEPTANIYEMQDLVRVVDNVVILFDSSSSMAEPYGDSGMTKLQAAKKLLKQRGEWFPDVFPELNVGLYSYTPKASLLPNKGYEVFYKMQPFNKEAFINAVDSLPEKASGPTLLQGALSRLDKLLETLTGRTVVFIFSDGSHSGTEFVDRPVVLARKLAEKHDVFFQVISTADIAKNLEIMEAVASVNESSRVYPFGLFLDRPEIYSGAVFAIEDYYMVVTTYREKVLGYKLDHLLFDYDKAEIRPEFTRELDAAGEMLRDNPGELHDRGRLHRQPRH